MPNRSRAQHLFSVLVRDRSLRAERRLFWLYFVGAKCPDDHVFDVRRRLRKIALHVRVFVPENAKYFVGESLPNLVDARKIENNNLESIDTRQQPFGL